MRTTDLISALGSVLSVEETAPVVAALRQDPLVWASLAEPRFSALAMERIGSHFPGWNPGRLALLALGEPFPLDRTPDGALAPLNPELQERALHAFQAAQRSLLPPTSLADAGLLALALRERRRLTGTWTGLLKELLPKNTSPAGAFLTWRTAFACLYSLVPDAEEMLRGLLPRMGHRLPLEWITHALLSQPLDEEAHFQAFNRLLAGLPVSLQLVVLRSLNLRGRRSLAARLAGHLVIGHPAFAALRAHPNAADLDLNGLSARALALQQMGAFYQLSGDSSQALSLFESAEQALEQWHAGLALQKVNLQSTQGADHASMMIPAAQSARLASAADWLKNELGAALLSHPYAASVLDQLSGEDESPFLRIRRAQELFDREPAVARDLARQGAADLLAELRQQSLLVDGDFVYAWQPETVLSALVDLELPDEALALAQSLLDLHPTCTGLLSYTSQVMARLGRLDAALNCARSTAALAPQDPDSHRLLGSLWDQTRQWRKSLEEWQRVLELSPQPAPADRLACAQAALRTGDLALVMELVDGLLNEDANNGAALGLLGQALIARGEQQQAVNHLVRATLLAPENLDPWLALAQVQKELGDPQRALESLRAAVTALPEAAEAHLALGRACAENGLMAEALPHLKKALDLGSVSDDTALLYGRTLRLMGHTAEARQVLERARASWNTCPELAFEYAQVLLDQNDAEGALPVLEAALHHGLPVLEGSLLYARILLGEFRNCGETWDPEVTRVRMQQASQALRSILEVDPENLEAHFLLADALRETGQHEEALAAYRALADKPISGDLQQRQRFIARVQWGIGRTALALNQIDTALAALKEACQVQPDSLPFQRALAEACWKADLLQEALEAANLALRLASDDLDTLAWYADLVVRLNEPQLAVDALRRAVQLDPQRADLLVNLASVQCSAGELSAARASLQAVTALSSASREDLHRAGHIYLRLEDTPSALACFEMALAAGTSVPADLLIELAQLNDLQGNNEVALDLIQQALAEVPNNLPALLLQADLLGRLDRPQAALAVLERALRVAQDGGQEQRTLLGDIHQRFTHLLFQSGDLSSALEHAEKALVLQPANPALGVRAADLALALLQPERAARLLQAFSVDEAELAPTLLSKGLNGLAFLCLKVETALDALHDAEVEGQEAQLSTWVEAALEATSGEPAMQEGAGRLMAARARLLARQGDLSAAREQFAAALHRTVVQEVPWLARAALETQRWKDALALAERRAAAYPEEPRACLDFARTLVLAAEQQRLCQALDCRANAPGALVLSESSQKQFETAVRTAGQLANVGEVARWQARGRAAFNPASQAARILASLPSRPEDTAALVTLLYQLNNHAAAFQVARRYMDHPLVLLPLSLCCLENPTPEGAALAEQAVLANPNQPLARIARAKIAQRMGELNTALEEYENALLIWPDEPQWHAAAGELCLQVGDLRTALVHLRRALELEPDNPGFAFRLGQACLSDEDVSDAVIYLERSTVLDPNQAAVWLDLAAAYHLAERLPQAMEAARKAAELDPASAQGLLIAGETALSLKQPAQALEFARSAVRREPENAAAVLFLCNTFVLLEKPAEGLDVLENASPSVKAVFPVAFERAKLIRQLHGPKAAVDTLEKLARDYPEEPDLLGFLARTQADCGELKSAERYAFRALRLDPNQPDLTLMLARLQRKTGQLDQAVHLLSEAIRMSPQDLETYLELGSVYQERREFSPALQIFKQAMQIAPDDYRAFYQSGLILRDNKDYAPAETMLRRAAELAPDNLSIRRQLVAVIALNLVHHQQQEASLL